MHELRYLCLEWIEAKETKRKTMSLISFEQFETYSIVLTAMVSLHHQLHRHRMVDMIVYSECHLILDRHSNLFRYYRSLCVSYPL